MDYRTILSRPLSKSHIDEVVLSVCTNQDELIPVFELIFDTDNMVAWRAAWACVKVSEQHPTWFTNQQLERIISFSLHLKHGGTLRGCLSILSNVALSDSITVEFINACFYWMVSPQYPIAVQALSMKILYRICQIESDFVPELKACLENVDPYCYSAGFNSTRKKILKSLCANFVG